MNYPMKLTRFDVLARIFTAIGALNWGIIGVGGQNFILKMLWKWPLVVQSVYILIGVFGLYGLWSLYLMFDSKVNVTKQNNPR